MRGPEAWEAAALRVARQEWRSTTALAAPRPSSGLPRSSSSSAAVSRRGDTVDNEADESSEQQRRNEPGFRADLDDPKNWAPPKLFRGRVDR